MKSEEKTNVMRLLDQKKIPYASHTYVHTGAVSAVEVAAALGQDPARVATNFTRGFIKVQTTVDIRTVSRSSKCYISHA